MACRNKGGYKLTKNVGIDEALQLYPLVCVLFSMLSLNDPPSLISDHPPPSTGSSLNSCLTSTPLLIQPVSKAASTATPPTIHLGYSQPPQLTPGPTPSTPVPRDPSSVTAHTTPQHPSPTEEKHPSPSPISDHPTPDVEVPSTTQLATVTTPLHILAQKNTGMNQVVLMIAVECDCQLLTSNIIVSLCLYFLQFHLTSNHLSQLSPPHLLTIQHKTLVVRLYHLSRLSSPHPLTIQHKNVWSAADLGGGGGGRGGAVCPGPQCKGAPEQCQTRSNLSV